jgi:hypothetical protein
MSVIEEGHARDLDIASTNLPSNLYTYVRDTCKFSRFLNAPVVFIRQYPRPGAEIYPYSFLRTRANHCIFALFWFV